MAPEPEAWQTDQPGRFLTVEGVSLWALGKQRFRIVAPDGERDVEGVQRAREPAHELAGV